MRLAIDAKYSEQEWPGCHSLFLKEISMNLVRIKDLLEKKVTEFGFDLVSINRKVEKGDVYLSIVVDRIDPIDMNTIVSLSESLSSYLDEIDDSNDKYVLDISSLGAEKPLKIADLSKYVGRYIHVHLVNAQEGENIFEGDLLENNEDSITLSYRINTRVKKLVILHSNIYKIRLAIKF